MMELRSALLDVIPVTESVSRVPKIFSAENASIIKMQGTEIAE
jgi:hypothetical protein